MPVNSDSPLHGLLIIDKTGFDPANPTARLWTSHDVVARVRRLSGQRRIGHTGTLDPMASGLLILCLGQATRLVEYYQGHGKRYEALVALGTATDTYDAMGQVSTQAAVPPLSVAQIEAALDGFRGEIMQTPPIFSALKQEGEALYAKARRGEEVTVAARPVTIHQLSLLEQTATTLKLDVICSAGTYIRSLAHDLGKALGTVAHLATLRRTEAGSFRLNDAHTLTELEAAAQAGTLGALLLPLGVELGLPILTMDETTALRLSHGQRVPLETKIDGELALAQSTNGEALGIVRRIDSQTPSPVWKAEKWLALS